MVAGFAVELMILLTEGERLTKDWWVKRYRWSEQRAGAMPAEIMDPLGIRPKRVADPETGDQYARVTIPLAAGTTHGRAWELSHMLVSMLSAEGYTLRRDGERFEELPGEQPEQPEGELGSLDFTAGRVCGKGCMACIFSTDTRHGCCGEGAQFTLADIGFALLKGDEAHVARVLSLPGERQGDIWQPTLAGGICIFHHPSTGCTLPSDRMPLQCRTYLCRPEQLLPAAVAAEYQGYVDALEGDEAFIEEHMRAQSGVDFASPISALKDAAVRAFAALAEETARHA